MRWKMTRNREEEETRKRKRDMSLAPDLCGLDRKNLCLLLNRRDSCRARLQYLRTEVTAFNSLFFCECLN